MAGSDGSPDSHGFAKKPSDGLGKPAAPKVKNFACSHCGASINLRTPGESLVVVCGTCQSTIDVTDENYRIIRVYKEIVAKHTPTISLGSRAELFGRKWEVIGYIVREDVSSQYYYWDEYLLFNPYYGYRWLIESAGHWSFVRPLKETPEQTVTSSYAEYASFENKKYRLFNRGQARVIYALGEFYWTIKVNDTVFMDDYICPPQMLSLEKDDKEVNWSICEYVDPNVILEAFKFRGSLLPRPRGVGANQPSELASKFNQIKSCWILFILVITGLQFYGVNSASEMTVLNDNYQFVPATDKGKTITSKVFELSKEKGNLEIDLNANVQNSWLYISGQLVNNDTGVTFDFDRSIEYYWGVDGGESWTEGSTAASILLSSVPKGKYYLNFDCESAPEAFAAAPISFSARVVSNVPYWVDYLVCLFLISITPIWLWSSSRSFEVRRWSESDYSPYPSTN